MKCIGKLSLLCNWLAHGIWEPLVFKNKSTNITLMSIFCSFTSRFLVPKTNPNEFWITNLENSIAATSRCPLAPLNFPITFYRKLFKTTFKAYTERNHVWKFHWPVTIYKNSTAVTILTAATSRCLLAPLNFPITFYRKLYKTTFEAYTVRNHVWKFHWPVTIYKNSTAVKILAAATSRCLLAPLNFPITFYRKLYKTFFEAYTIRNHVWKFHCPVACNSWKNFNSC